MFSSKAEKRSGDFLEDSKPKVLFLIQLPPPIHGAAVVNKSVQESHLINETFKTHYVDISPAKDMADIGKISLFKLGLTFLIFFRAVAAYIKFKPDLLYMTLSPHGLAFYKDGLLAFLLKALGARMVFHMHGKGVAKAAETSVLKCKIYRIVFKNVDVIHLSESLFSDLDGVRDQTRSIVALPNGVSPVECGENPRDTNKVTFVYLSNLVRSKGADILVRAAALIPKELQSSFELKIVGSRSDDVYFSEFSKHISESKYGNICFLGPKYGKEKDDVLCSSDVFILPTKNDCFPLSILEAMSAGLAVISTREGAIPDIVESGITGSILNECKPENLAAAMSRFIVDADYLSSCRKSSKDKYRRNYTTKAFEKKLASVIGVLLAPARRI